MEPWGIQVSLIESLRFLLLNAVIIPITKKTFGRLLDCPIPVSIITGDLSSLALEALAAESRISKEEIDLSKVLKTFAISWSFLYRRLFYQKYREITKSTAKFDAESYMITSCVCETWERMSLFSTVASCNKHNELPRDTSWANKACHISCL